MTQSTAPDEDVPTHYVLVIHGTWNRPGRGFKKWYQLDKNNPDNFCGRLNELVRPVFGDAVWRPCRGTPLRFSWRGENTDEGRISAARRLYRLLVSIGRRDPSAVIHLVAHSHGGNAVLHALELYFEDLKRQLDPYAHALRGGLYAEHFRSQNRIGRLVFLGTPFLRKTWDKSPRIPAMLSQAIIALGFAPFAALLLAFVGLPLMLSAGVAFVIRAILARAFGKGEAGKPARRPAIANVLSSLGSSEFVGTKELMILSALMTLLAIVTAVKPAWFGSPAWQVLAWIWLIALAVGGGVLGFYGAIKQSERGRPTSDNIYFRSKDIYLATGEPILGALVVHAGLIDEAQLAMSSYSIALAYLSPILDSLTSFRPRPRVTERVRGSTGDKLADAILSVQGWLTHAIAAVFMILATPLTWVASIVTRRLGRTLLSRVLASAATGVGPHEFSLARITTEPWIGVPLIREWVWDVSRLLVLTPPKSATNAGPNETRGDKVRFSFLWDSKALADKEGESVLWERVRKSLPKAGGWHGAFEAGGEANGNDRLLRGCLILQEHIKGIAGAIELTHSAYYSNDDVIRGIASFLVSGKVVPVDTGGAQWSVWDGATCPSTG